MDKPVSQRFGVEEIRRIREEDDIRYQSMTPEEISKDISKGANEFRRRMEEIRRNKAARQVV